VANGVDYQRVALLLAVLEKCLGVPLQAHDVYVNVVGGLYLNEPAIDLGIIVAVASSLKDTPLDPHCIAFGEVGLSGEIRAVGHAEARVREAAKLGFRRCLLPQVNCQPAPQIAGIELCGVRTVREALQMALQQDLTRPVTPMKAGFPSEAAYNSRFRDGIQRRHEHGTADLA
jgi:DNA repair protein RadA/Sms